MTYGRRDAREVSNPHKISMKYDFDQHKDNYRNVVDESVRFSGRSVDFFTRAKAHHLLGLIRANFENPRRVRALDV